MVARYDVSQVDWVSDSSWNLIGEVVDLTGSYTAADVDTGYKITQRGVDAMGRVVYDRFIITSIVERDENYLSIIVRADTIKNNAGQPLTGSFPIGAWNYKANWYKAQIDPDYETGIDNLNLNENSSVHKWERQVENEDENQWALPFSLKDNAVIIYNGSALQAKQWNGVGSSILTVNVNVKIHDTLILIN
jgi:hypothetical protein